jgi:hypothetical protein
MSKNSKKTAEKRFFCMKKRQNVVIRFAVRWCEDKIKSGKNYQILTSYQTKSKTKQKVRK